MRYVVWLLRVLTGGLFIFSGLIKLNDPVGMQIKLEEYFEVFAHDFAAWFLVFAPWALPLALFISTLEVVLGAALLVRFRPLLTLGTLLALTIFFTFLTFYSAYFNKVTDCGCFGDAIPLTPWQSFGKDVILLVALGALLAGRRYLGRPSGPALGWGSVGVATALSLGLGAYALRNLPPLDFRPYRVGANLPMLMQPSGELKYHYIMEKEGRQEILAAYPTDPAYTYKDIVLTNPEVLPKITDYSVWHDEGDVTAQTFEGVRMLVIVHQVQDLSPGRLAAANQLANDLRARGLADTWVLTASAPEAFEPFRHEAQLAAPYYFADATVLKTMIRSNPGLMLLENGVVRGKWHYRNTPSADEVARRLAGTATARR